MDRQDLLKDDPKLFTYKLMVVIFVVGPAIIVFIKERGDFIHAYRDAMLFAFSWPILVLAGLYFFRRRFLVRLMENGREVHGTVKRVIQSRSGRMSGKSNWHTAQVSVRVDGEEKLVEVEVEPYSVRENSEVTLLIDPLKSTRGVFLKSSQTPN